MSNQNREAPPPFKMNRLDLNQIAYDSLPAHYFVFRDAQTTDNFNYDAIQMDPSATFYPSKATDIDPDFG